MNKMKICWITSTFLLDVDIPIVPHLQSLYDIDWIVLTTPSNIRGDMRLIELAGCFRYRMIETSGLFIHPKKYFFFKQLLREIKSADYDLYYFDFLGMPYFMPLVQKMLSPQKCVIAAHNVKTPKGARYYWLAKPYMDYVVRKFNRFQVFSKNQFDLLTSINRKAKVLYAPLCLKDYGKPTIEKPQNPITFLFFGNIVEYKRVDILINAVNLLCERGINEFKVKIYGYCRQKKWEESYLPLIKNSNLIETDIRRIPNEDIPNLFQSSHYFVMPYQDIAQSGAMTVALQYNLPIIASDLDVFKEFMNGKDDGYFFKSGSAERLADVMEEVINNHAERFEKMRDYQARFVKETLSSDAIISKYRDYFNQLCRN